MKVNFEALERFNQRLMKKGQQNSDICVNSTGKKQKSNELSFDEMKLFAQTKSAEKIENDAKLMQLNERNRQNAKLEQLKHKKELKQRIDAECEAKTRRFFDVKNTRFGAKHIENGTVYYGDQSIKNRCWLANGSGEYSIKGNVLYTGPFLHHAMHGRAGQLILSDTDEKISGSFVDNFPHGLCESNTAMNRLSLFWHGFRICFLDELVEGTQIIINDTEYGVILSNLTSFDEFGKITVKMSDSLLVKTFRIIGTNFRVVRHGSQITHIVAESELNALRLDQSASTSNHSENFFSDKAEEIQKREDRLRRNEDMSKGREELARKQAENRQKLKTQQARKLEEQLLSEGLQALQNENQQRKDDSGDT